MIDHKRVSVEAGKFLEVTGPAALRLVKGEAVLMGKRLAGNDVVIVPQWRTYAIKALTDVEVDVSVTKTTELKVVEHNVAEEWEKGLREVVGLKRVVIAGPTDSGKSSVTATLVNLNLNEGYEVSVVDSDVGQSNLCFPTMVCKAKVKDYVFTLSDLKAEEQRFTGTITPAVERGRVVSSVASLAKGRVVVDTDGWVDGYEAGCYKQELLRAISPDAVVYLGKAPWWARGPWKLVELPPSTGKERTRQDRRSIRKNKYKKALDGCKTKDIDLNEVPALFSVIFNSPWGDEALKESVRELIGVKPLLVVPWGTRVIAVVRKGSKYKRVQQVEVIEEGEERGLLVGLGDERGNERLGEVVKIDYLNKIMKVRTCFEGKPKYVIFGRVKLSEDYSDKVCKKPF